VDAGTACREAMGQEASDAKEISGWDKSNPFRLDGTLNNVRYAHYSTTQSVIDRMPRNRGYGFAKRLP